MRRALGPRSVSSATSRTHIETAIGGGGRAVVEKMIRVADWATSYETGPAQCGVLCGEIARLSRGKFWGSGVRGRGAGFLLRLVVLRVFEFQVVFFLIPVGVLRWRDAVSFYDPGIV